MTRFVAFIAGNRASPAQPANNFHARRRPEFSAQRGRLTSGDSFGAHGVGERGLKLADSMFGLIDPAVLPARAATAASRRRLSAPRLSGRQSAIVRDRLSGVQSRGHRRAVRGRTSGPGHRPVRQRPQWACSTSAPLSGGQSPGQHRCCRSVAANFRRRTRNGGDRTSNGEPAGHLTPRDRILGKGAGLGDRTRRRSRLGLDCRSCLKAPSPAQF